MCEYPFVPEDESSDKKYHVFIRQAVNSWCFLGGIYISTGCSKVTRLVVWIRTFINPLLTIAYRSDTLGETGFQQDSVLQNFAERHTFAVNLDDLSHGSIG
jgi:hypothetical protein